MIVMFLRGWLTRHHPSIDPIIPGGQQGFILVKLFILQRGKMACRKPAKKQVRFLHTGIA